MKVRLTAKAARDLQNIQDYLSERSPQGRRSVVADIRVVIQSLQDGVARGRKTPRHDVFEKVSAKYGYVMPYTLRNGEVFILRVYDSRQRGIDYSPQSKDI